MKTEGLSNEQKVFVINAINVLGDGGCPVASIDTLEYFTDDYVIEIVSLASDKVKDEHKPMVADILGILKAA